jgi:sterol desaturase/sphingolipid hydroxylase (fatty acid hydroxylase superfamily)
MNLDAEALQRTRGLASLGWLAILLAWESAAPFYREFTSTAERSRHGLRNFAIGAANALLTAIVFATLWRQLADVSARQGFGLLNWSGLPPAAHFVAALLLFDLWTYWWHRAGHHIPGLWHFHRMHHSDPQMDVTTANRFHAVEILLSSVSRVILIPLLGFTFAEVVVYETLLQFFVQLQHANLGLPAPVERLLRLLFVTPLLHKVHHSRFQPETDSNYASLFSFWDRLFGTLRVRRDPENIRLGLEGFDGAEFQGWAGLWRTPFREPGVGDAGARTVGAPSAPKQGRKNPGSGGDGRDPQDARPDHAADGK